MNNFVVEIRLGNKSISWNKLNEPLKRVTRLSASSEDNPPSTLLATDYLAIKVGSLINRKDEEQ